MEDYHHTVDFLNTYDYNSGSVRKDLRFHQGLLIGLAFVVTISLNILLGLVIACGVDCTLDLVKHTLFICLIQLVFTEVATIFSGLLLIIWTANGGYGFFTTLGLTIMLFVLIMLVFIGLYIVKKLIEERYRIEADKREWRLQNPELAG
jgi:heme exporter protein D